MSVTKRNDRYVLPTRQAMIKDNEKVQSRAADRVMRPVVLHVLTTAQSLVFLTGQLRYLQAQGFSATVACDPTQAMHHWTRREAVQAVELRMKRQPAPMSDFVSLVRLCALIHRVRPVVVHTHTPKASLLGMLAAALCRVPVRVFHLHGLGCTAAHGTGSIVTKFLERLTALLATDVICVSPSLRAAAVDLRIVDPAKSVVLGSGSANGVDTDRFHPIGEAQRASRRRELGFGAHQKVVGFVGRLTPEKGIEELYAAFQALRARGVRAGLLLVGALDDRLPISAGTLEELAKDPDVRMVGYAHDTWRYYQAMDVVALASWREGFGVCAIEAAACAVPVVATDVVGCRDAVVDGTTGTLVPVRNVLALSQALEQYLLDPSLALIHGEAGRNRVAREFQPEKIWASVLKLYTERLNNVDSRPVLARDLNARTGC
jgi:glycosyltransferase involved in cell wall biosynthesis